MGYTRVHRLLRILTLVQSRSGWTARDLAAECGVEERTIFRDLNELGGAGVPIVFDSATGGYRVQQEFFLPPVQLTAEEALSMGLLCEHIAQHEQIPYLKPAWRALHKLVAQLPESVREEVNSVLGQMAVQTERAVPPDGHSDVYDRIREAIATKRALVCSYESLSGGSPDEIFDFEPYTLFFCVRTWYAIGFHSGRDAVRCLRLNRFTKVTPTERPYEIPDSFSLESHLGNAWRMIRGDTEYDVELRFSPEFAQTVSDTRWRPNQSLEFHQDGSVTLKFRVAGLAEIVWWVLSYGPHCVVVEPPMLRDRVSELARRTFELYGGPARAAD
jgi:predicted DNA-binding transcriptional regulator YafY